MVRADYDAGANLVHAMMPHAGGDHAFCHVAAA